jgi:hypothetical protein
MSQKWMIFALLPALVVGCKKSNEQPPAQDGQGFTQGQSTGYPAGEGGTGAQTGQTPVGQTPPPADAGAQPGQTPQLGSVATDPNVLQNILAGALAGGAASLGALTGGELGTIQEGIKMNAKTHAKGMQPEGQLMSAKLQQDGHAQAPLTLEAGKCYTIVGFGGMGVFDFRINLISAPPAPPQVLAQSSGNGAAPVVGSGEQCIRNPLPTPMVVNVDMHVAKGTGMVGAQAYRK